MGPPFIGMEEEELPDYASLAGGSFSPPGDWERFHRCLREYMQAQTAMDPKHFDAGPDCNLWDHNAPLVGRPFYPPGTTYNDDNVPGPSFQTPRANPYVYPCLFTLIASRQESFEFHALEEDVEELWNECEPPPIDDGSGRCHPIGGRLNGFNFVIDPFAVLLVGPDVLADQFSFLDTTVDFLWENQDLVYWVACLFGPELEACIKAKFDEGVTVVLHSGQQWTNKDGVASPYTFASAGMGIVHVWQPFMDNGLTVYKLGGLGSNACCALALAAAMLMHEVVHLCKEEVDAKDEGFGKEPDSCAWAYMYQNTLLWAIGQRYPSVVGAEGCNYLDEDSLFMNPHPSGVGQAPSYP